MAAKSNAKVVIVDAGGEYLVQPAAVLLEKTGAGQGDTLRIFNASQTDDALFFIADGSVFTNNAAPQSVVIPKKKSITLQLDNGAAANVYTYQILMIQSGKKAKGNSDPVIIVEN